MPGPIRRSRLVALLLLLLTPGLGGWAVQALHPCPADMPSATAASRTGHDEGHHHQGAPGHSGHSAECRCIGSCQAALVARTSDAPTVDAPIPAFQLILPRPATTRVLAEGRTPELHPPATAPPILS
jgi:hypothetical protein